MTSPAGYFAGDRKSLKLPMEPRGVAFQRLVWGLIGLL